MYRICRSLIDPEGMKALDEWQLQQLLQISARNNMGECEPGCALRAGSNPRTGATPAAARSQACPLPRGAGVDTPRMAHFDPGSWAAVEWDGHGHANWLQSMRDEVAADRVAQSRKHRHAEAARLEADPYAEMMHEEGEDAVTRVLHRFAAMHKDEIGARS